MPIIKALFLAANPLNTSRLAIDAEMRSIEQKVRAAEYRDVLIFQSAWAVQPDDLLQLLNQHRPHIVHFSGHGNHAGISLVNNNGQEQLVTTRALTALFTTLKDNIQLVFLNACYSSEQAQTLITIIDCVIGMKKGIRNDAATIFASSFYRAIGFGRSVQEAFDQGKTALLLEGIPKEDIPELLVKEGIDPKQIVLIGPTENPFVDLSRSQSTTSVGLQQVQIWNVPHLRNPHFTGRDELLDQLTQQLSPKAQQEGMSTRRAALTQAQAIKGLGGIGKTQVAVEYAYRSQELNRYAHTLWVNAANEETIITSFVEIAELLPNFTAKDETDQHKLITAVRRWLEQCPQCWLLIFDNADDITLVHSYIPQKGNGSVLLTTRADAVGSIATSIEVQTMGFIEGTQLLLRRAQRFEHASDEDVNQAGNIVVALDHFPLALDQAGAYIEETRCSFTDYLTVYQDHRNELLARRGAQTTDYPDSVATTWSLSFQKVQHANPAAAELLQLCAFLAPDRIPEELIKVGSAQWPPLLQKAATDLFTFQQMIAELLKFSLVKRLTDDNTLSIHRLVQAVQKDMLKPETQRNWAEWVVRAVNDAFPEKPQNVSTWAECLRYLDQAQECYTLIEQYNLVFVEAASILNRTGLYLHDHALYSIVEPLYLRTLAIREQQLGPKHPATATSFNNLAALYQHQGRYSEAEILYEKALDIDIDIYGKDNTEIATDLSNLAALYDAQGKYEQAEPLLQRTLAIREQQLGPTHPDTASSLNSLALLYSSQGRYSEAEPLYLRGLAIREQIGPEHPGTANCLNNLADLYQMQGRYSEAEPLHLRALAIRELQLGPTHPSTATSLNNLAVLYRSQGKDEQAEPLYLRALDIDTYIYGDNHPNVATDLNNLALIYDTQGKYEQAESMYLQALNIDTHIYGATHPNIATSLSNLALIYDAQGKYEQAESLLQRALAIREQQLGPTHPDTATNLNNLALIYDAQGKYEQAESLLQRALAIRKQQLGPTHPDTADSLNSLAALYYSQSMYDEAEPLYISALAIREQRLGPTHIDTASCLNNLAALYYAQDKYSEAERLYQRALSIYEDQLGREHPTTQTILENYSLLVIELEQEARELETEEE